MKSSPAWCCTGHGGKACCSIHLFVIRGVSTNPDWRSGAGSWLEPEMLNWWSENVKFCFLVSLSLCVCGVLGKIDNDLLKIMFFSPFYLLRVDVVGDQNLSKYSWLYLPKLHMINSAIMQLSHRTHAYGSLNIDAVAPIPIIKKNKKHPCGERDLLPWLKRNN